LTILVKGTTNGTVTDLVEKIREMKNK